MTKSAGDKTNDGMCVCVCVCVCVITINHYRLIVIRISLSFRHQICSAVSLFWERLFLLESLYGDMIVSFLVAAQSARAVYVPLNEPALVCLQFWITGEICWDYKMTHVRVIKRALPLSLKLRRVVCFCRQCRKSRCLCTT